MTGHDVAKNPVKLTTPVDRGALRDLVAGDRVELSGDILVFRDQVHGILCNLIGEGRELPFDIGGEVLYYCGPTPARHGMPVGSAGPTTSARMDRFTGPLLERGLAATIGKVPAYTADTGFGSTLKQRPHQPTVDVVYSDIKITG